MGNMIIVGTAAKHAWSSADEFLRLYRIDTKVMKDVSLNDLLANHPQRDIPVHEVLGIANFADFTELQTKRLYPRYLSSKNSSIMSGADACYVLGTHGQGGYVCIRPHAGTDYIRVIPRSRLVQDAKKGRLKLINAVIEQTDMHDTISPIEGAWEDMTHLTGRNLADGSDDAESAGLAPDKRDKIAAGDSVTSHDELGMLGTEQKEFLKDYYIDYSVEAFNRIAGQTSWKLKAGKTEKLVELRKISGGEDWRFAGMWDSGRFGGDRCEFGHKLRYVYMACPVSQNFITAKQAGTLLKFGIVCHADFLEIPREDVARLGRLQDTMCDEIAFISTAVANNSVDKHHVLMSSMIDLLGRLQANGNMDKVLGERLTAAYTGFRTHNLPLVESFVLDVQRKLEDYGTMRVLGVAGIDTSDMITNVPELYEIPVLSATASQFEKKNHTTKARVAHQDGLSSIYRAAENLFAASFRYADQLIKNDICGEYMYVPTHEVTEFRKRNAEKYKRYDRNDVALRYNDETRELRKNWMSYFSRHTLDPVYMVTTDGLKCQHLTLAGFEKFLNFARRVQTTAKNIESGVGKEIIGLIDTKFSDMYSLGTGHIDVIQPRLLMYALPYNTGVSNPVALRRRAVNYLKSQADVSSVLDEVQDGTKPEYIQAVKDYFAPQLPKEAPQPVPVAPPSATYSFQTVLPASEMAALEQNLQEAIKEAVQESAQQFAQTPATPPQASPDKPQQSRRGDPAEAKSMTDAFETLYNRIKAVESKPDEYLGEQTIKIAVDIIARFRGKLKEKEGFTRQEKWRVDNETKRLQLLENQLKRNGKL